MKGFLRILLYYFTSRSVVTGAVLAGALLLVLALNAWLLSPYAAFSIALLAYLGLLIVPSITAAPALRCMISSRNLSIIPHFSLKAGLALLVLTVMTALFLPLMAWALQLRNVTFWFVPKMFVLASLYAGVMQLVLSSRHAMIMFALLPPALVLLLKFFGVSLLALAGNNVVVVDAALITLLGWCYALRLLARQQGFKPAFKSGHTGFSQHNAIQSVGNVLGFNLHGEIPAAPSLLFAYPASLPVRIYNVAAWILLYPLINTLMMRLMTPLIPPMQFFLAMSLFMGCIGCWAMGEISARARLLWLRVPGGRAQLWRKLEQELWTNFVLQAAILLLIVTGVLLINPQQAWLQHYLLVIVACSCFDSYLNLCSRLYQWPSLVQALAFFVSLCAIIAAVYFGLRYSAISVLIWLETGLLLLALLFRSLAKWQFDSVDWLVLKHEISPRAAAAA